MPEINLLDKHTAELIAAGEVVERPASAVKELVENSIDSGATSITTEIADGGISYIRITDNGCGIDRKNIKKAFLRHATSKVKNETDLEAISTLGFRGEALPSIAAVSRVDMLTRSSDEETGTRYIIEGSEEILLEDAGCPCGTTVTIKDIFFNTPARMKFLKKNVSEGNAVADVIERLSLSHPEISFRFIRDGKSTMITPGDGKLLSSIRAVFGKEFTSSLIPVDYSENGMMVSGYISKPVFSRATRAMQTFFVNSRFVKTGTGSAALSEAYKNSVMTGKFPACVLMIDIPYGAVDANVHPAKTEIRFSDERRVFSLIYYAAKNALSKGDTRPQAILEKGTSAPGKAFSGFPNNPYKPSEKPVQTVLEDSVTEKNTAVSSPAASIFTHSPEAEAVIKTEPFKSEKITSAYEKPDNSHGFSSGKTTYAAKNIDIEYSEPEPKPEKGSPAKAGVSGDIATFTADGRPEAIHKTEDTASAVPDTGVSLAENAESPAENETGASALSSGTDAKAPPVKLIGEAFGTYIFAEVGSRIMVIDKHAAHERIIFDRLRSTPSGGEAQQLISPVRVRLSRKHYDVLLHNLDTLKKAGIDAEDFGSGDIAVRGVPLLTDPGDITALLEETAEKLSEHRPAETDHTDWVFHSVACRAAVKAGDRSDEAELRALLERIAADDSVRYCPHGRPVAFFITRKELERNFGRI